MFLHPTLGPQLDQLPGFDVIYFDFATAFDTVPHSCLLTKLQGYGIRCKAAECVKQYLQDRRLRVVVVVVIKVGLGQGNKWDSSRKCTGINPLSFS